MTFTGRYHLIREWWLPTGSLSEPYVLDRRDMALRPYKGNGEARAEWGPREDRRESVRKWERFKQRVSGEATDKRRWRLAERLLSREGDCARTAALFGQADLYTPTLLGASPIASLATLALDSAYTAGSAGDVIGTRYQPSVTRTLNTVYFYVSSYTGTAANVNDLNLELRAEASTGATTPNTSATLATATKDPASATGWVASTGWSTSLTALSRYFVCVGDADGNGTDFATLNQRIVYYVSSDANDYFGNRLNSAQSTAGWASGNSFLATSVSCLVLAFADGTSFGNPFSVATTPASNTQQRGLRITTAGLIANLPIFGVRWGALATSALTGIKIFTGDTAPDGSADHTSTSLMYGTTAANSIGCFTSTGAAYTLTAGTAYSIVTTYGSAATTGPRRADIGTGEDATLRKAMPGAGEFYWRQDGGGSTWANDLVGSMPTMGLLVDGQVAASAGGVLIAGGMVGGMRG